MTIPRPTHRRRSPAREPLDSTKSSCAHTSARARRAARTTRGRSTRGTATPTPTRSYADVVTRAEHGARRSTTSQNRPTAALRRTYRSLFEDALVRSKASLRGHHPMRLMMSDSARIRTMLHPLRRKSTAWRQRHHTTILLTDSASVSHDN